jgi:hypothetical protein
MTRWTRTFAVPALALALLAGVAAPASAQEPEPAAEGEGGGGSGPVPGYAATGVLAALGLFIVCKSARR